MNFGAYPHHFSCLVLDGTKKGAAHSVGQNDNVQSFFSADKKGLSVVVHKDTVVFGGVDITDDVVRAMQKG